MRISGEWESTLLQRFSRAPPVVDRLHDPGEAGRDPLAVFAAQSWDVVSAELRAGLPLGPHWGGIAGTLATKSQRLASRGHAESQLVTNDSAQSWPIRFGCAQLSPRRASLRSDSRCAGAPGRAAVRITCITAIGPTPHARDSRRRSPLQAGQQRLEDSARGPLSRCGLRSGENGPPPRALICQLATAARTIGRGRHRIEPGWSALHFNSSGALHAGSQHRFQKVRCEAATSPRRSDRRARQVGIEAQVSPRPGTGRRSLDQPMLPPVPYPPAAIAPFIALRFARQTLTARRQGRQPLGLRGLRRLGRRRFAVGKPLHGTKRGVAGGRCGWWSRRRWQRIEARSFHQRWSVPDPAGCHRRAREAAVLQIDPLRSLALPTPRQHSIAC